MGKAKGEPTTPKQRTATERRANLKRMVEEANAIDKELADLERAIVIEGVRTGAILPSWAEKLLKPPTEPEPEQTGEGRQMARVRPVLRDMFPPDGIPPGDVRTGKVVADVQKMLPDMKRDVIARAIGRRKP